MDGESAACLRKGIMSGVTIFKENVHSQEQLIELTDSVRKLSWHQALITVDQEGGPVQRLEGAASPLPSMMAMGKLDESKRLEMLIKLSAKQLSLLGINCVLAPVMDVNTNRQNPIIGTRALGETPEKVARLSAIILPTYLEAGILPVAKHFPGHGDTAIDSHLDLPALKHSLERIQEIELLPFRENLLVTPALLVAHLWISALDEEVLPSTLSYNVCSKLLKEEMGYNNLVFSDDMLMKAITKNWGLQEACVRAIAAGVDILLVCSGPDEVRSVHEALMKAVSSGRISEERILAAVRARQAALSKIALPEEMERPRRLAALTKSIAASEQMLLDCSIAAVEASRGDPSCVFAGQEKIDLYVPAGLRYELNFAKALIQEMPDLKDRIREHRYPPYLKEDEAEEFAKSCGARAIFVSFRAVLNDGQIKLASALSKACKERLLIAADLPYDIDGIAEFENAICAFDPSDLAVRAVAKFISRHRAGVADSCNFCGHKN